MTFCAFIHQFTALWCTSLHKRIMLEQIACWRQVGFVLQIFFVSELSFWLIDQLIDWRIGWFAKCKPFLPVLLTIECLQAEVSLSRITRIDLIACGSTFLLLFFKNFGVVYGLTCFAVFLLALPDRVTLCHNSNVHVSNHQASHAFHYAYLLLQNTALFCWTVIS